MATERKKGARGAPRTELVAIRFDPKTRYGLELAARIQRRSVANFVEWVIERSFKDVSIEPVHDLALADVLGQLWDVEESRRFYVLAKNHPDLLTHEEQIMWRLLQTKEESLSEQDLSAGDWLPQWYPEAKWAASADVDLDTLIKAFKGDNKAIQESGLAKRWEDQKKAK